MLPGCQLEGDLVRFDALNNCRIPVFALGFRLTDRDCWDEPWTNRFSNFKIGKYGYKRDAIRGACAVMPRAVGTIALELPVTVVSAIPSRSEVLHPGSELARLGAAIARLHGWAWAPEILSKREHRATDLPT